MNFNNQKLIFTIVIIVLVIIYFNSINGSKFSKNLISSTKETKKSDVLNFNKEEYFKDFSKRTESLPFVTGDTFRIFADCVLDQVTTSLPETIFTKQKPIIFIKTDYIQKFFNHYFHKFTNKIIIITHNSDYHITKNYINYLEDEKLEVWFAQNPEFYHPKLIAIPIGFINAHFNIDYLKVLNNYRYNTKPWNERKITLYINFNSKTNLKSRAKYLDYFKDFKGVKINKKRINFKTYFDDLNNSKFVLCPIGNGVDTQRFYETVLMGAIPIVASSTLDPIYNKSTTLILPSLDNLNQSMLHNPEEYIKDMSFSKNIVFMEYWLKKIYSFRQNVHY